jgi:hypothetical protein
MRKRCCATVSGFKRDVLLWFAPAAEVGQERMDREGPLSSYRGT